MHDTRLIIAMIMGAGGLLAVPPAVRIPPRGARPLRAGSPPARGRRAVTSGVLIGTGLLLLDPGLWWLCLMMAGVVAIGVRRRGPVRPAASRTADRNLIAAYCELLASCLDAGMVIASALEAVTDALTEFDPSAAAGRVGAGSQLDTVGSDARGADPGRVTSRAGPIDLLESVAAMLRLGAAPSTAWRIAEDDEDLAPIAAAACRSSAGGGALAQAVREHAAQLRQQMAAADLRSAGRAGVLMTAPLGVCFLPAFLCLGLAPVVVGLLGQLDMF